jgi:cysteine-rich repeat protein
LAGDGIRILDFEDCDDGNLVNGDGCNETMGIEAGWECLSKAGGNNSAVLDNSTVDSVCSRAQTTETAVAIGGSSVMMASMAVNSAASLSANANLWGGFNSLQSARSFTMMETDMPPNTQKYLTEDTNYPFNV